MHVISLKYKELGVMSGPQKDLKNPVLKGKLSITLNRVKIPETKKNINIK
jgi:hypothetical protein